MNPMSTARTGRFVQSGGQRAHYLESGHSDGPAVVLLHGLASLAQEIAQPLASKLAHDGFRVIAIDRPGYGQSDPLPKGHNSPFRQAKWLGHVLDGLGARVPTVIAHSTGAATALSLATHDRRALRGVILLSPFSRPTRPAAAPLLRIATAPIVGIAVRRLVLPQIAPIIGPGMVKAASGSAQDPVDPAGFPWRAMAKGSAVKAMAGELSGFNVDMVRLRTRLKRLECPIAVVAGTEDDVVDMPAQVRWLRCRVPRIHVHWMQGQGHLVHHGCPDAVAKFAHNIHHLK